MADDIGRSYGKLTLQGRTDGVKQLAHIQLLDGRNNTYIGLSAGSTPSIGGNNTFVGGFTGANAVSEAGTFVGYRAGRRATRVKDSCFFGTFAGELADRIDSSVCVGAYSGRKMTRANNNTLLGFQSGAELTSGSRNTIIGSYAAFSQFNGSDNVCIGHRSGYKNQIGNDNCYIGTNSGFSSYAGYENVCLGINSGYDLKAGTKNVLLGVSAGAAIANASNCIAIGTRAMEFFSQGDTNTCLGTQTARRLTGNNNTILGGYSMANALGSFNTVIGSSSMNRRNGWKVQLDRSVIVGEGITLDIPINAFDLRYEDAVQQSLEQTDANIIVFDTGLEDGESIQYFLDDRAERTTSVGSAHRGNVIFDIDTAPTGDVVLPFERMLALGSNVEPWSWHMANVVNGTYRVSWGYRPLDTPRFERPPQYEVSFEAGPCSNFHPHTHDPTGTKYDWRYQGSPVVAGAAAIPFVSTTVVSNIVSIQTANATTLAAGDSIIITNAADPSLNGTWTLANATTSNVLVFAANAVTSNADPLGLAANVAAGWHNFALPATGIQGFGNVCTVTTSAAHGLVAGQVVTVFATNVQPIAVVTATSDNAPASNVELTTSAAHGLVVGDRIECADFTTWKLNDIFTIVAVASANTLTVTSHYQTANVVVGEGTIVSRKPWAGDFTIANVTATSFDIVPSTAFTGNVTADLFTAYASHKLAITSSASVYCRLAIDHALAIGCTLPKPTEYLDTYVVREYAASGPELAMHVRPRTDPPSEYTTFKITGNVDDRDDPTKVFRILSGTFVTVDASSVSIQDGIATMYTKYVLAPKTSPAALRKAYETLVKTTPALAEASPEYNAWRNHRLMVPGGDIYVSGALVDFLNGFWRVTHVTNTATGGSTFSFDVSSLNLANGVYNIGFGAKAYLGRVYFFTAADGLRMYRDTDTDFPAAAAGIASNPRRVYVYVPGGHEVKPGEYVCVSNAVDSRLNTTFRAVSTPALDEYYEPLYDGVPSPRWNADYTSDGTDCWFACDLNFDLPANVAIDDLLGSQAVVYSSRLDKAAYYVQLEAFANTAQSMHMHSPSGSAMISYNARTDTKVQVVNINGPTTTDGHQHVGFGSQAGMDANLVSNHVLEFTDAGPSRAVYAIGTLSTIFDGRGTFSIPSTDASFGIDWCGQYSLDFVKTGASLDVVATSSGFVSSSVAVAQVTHERLALVGSIEAGRLPIDLSELVSFPQKTVAVHVYHDIDRRTMDIDLVLTGTDGNVANAVTEHVKLAITNAPELQVQGATVEFYANAFTQLSDIGVYVERFNGAPVFSNVVYLGSSQKVDAEEDRTDVFITSLGNVRLLRGTSDAFTVYSNRLELPTGDIVGRAAVFDTITGDGFGISNISMANISGLDFEHVVANTVVANALSGDGSGIFNIVASNVIGLDAALADPVANSVTANVVIANVVSAISYFGDGFGISNIAAANLTGLDVVLANLSNTVAILDSITANTVTAQVVHVPVVYGGNIVANTILVDDFISAPTIHVESVEGNVVRVDDFISAPAVYGSNIVANTIAADDIVCDTVTAAYFGDGFGISNIAAANLVGLDIVLSDLSNTVTIFNAITAQVVHAGNVHAGNVHAGNVHAGNVHADNVHADDVHATNVHAEFVGGNVIDVDESITAPVIYGNVVATDVETDTLTVSTLLSEHVVITDTANALIASVVSSTELEYLAGVTSSVQTQLDDKAAIAHTHDAESIVSGILAVEHGGTGVSSSTGSGGHVVLSDDPVLGNVQIEGTLAADGNVFINGTAYFANDTWHKSLDDEAMRSYYATNGATHFGSPDGYIWKNSTSGTAMGLADDNTLTLSGSIAAEGILRVTGTTTNWTDGGVVFNRTPDGTDSATYSIGRKHDDGRHIISYVPSGIGAQWLFQAFGTGQSALLIDADTGYVFARNSVVGGGWFRNSNPGEGLYNDARNCAFFPNDQWYGNWRISGNAANGWNGLNFSDAGVSVMCNDYECGFHRNGDGWRLYVVGNDLYVRGNLTAYWSDRRLKHYLRRIQDFDAILDGLTGYRFQWNDLGKKMLGKQSTENEDDVALIAQDVQQVLPEAVRINKAAREAGTTTTEAGTTTTEAEEEYLTIDYDKLVPVLVECLKSQRQRIQVLEATVRDITATVRNIEEALDNGL